MAHKKREPVFWIMNAAMGAFLLTLLILIFLALKKTYPDRICYSSFIIA